MTHRQDNASMRELVNSAEDYIAGGVVSLNRKVEPPITFVRAAGSKLFDIDGREYIDYHAAFAPHLLGHNDPDVSAAVVAAIARGESLMGTGTTPWEVELAQLLRESVASLDRVQITNTGSEATAHAIRLARAYTGRDDIILMLGGYNGWHNDVARTVMPTIDQIGPRVSPGEYPVLPFSAGIPADVLAHLHIVNFNVYLDRNTNRYLRVPSISVQLPLPGDMKPKVAKIIRLDDGKAERLPVSTQDGRALFAIEDVGIHTVCVVE